MNAIRVHWLFLSIIHWFVLCTFIINLRMPQIQSEYWKLSTFCISYVVYLSVKYKSLFGLQKSKQIGNMSGQTMNGILPTNPFLGDKTSLSNALLNPVPLALNMCIFPHVFICSKRSNELKCFINTQQKRKNMCNVTLNFQQNNTVQWIIIVRNHTSHHVDRRHHQPNWKSSQMEMVWRQCL